MSKKKKKKKEKNEYQVDINADIFDRIEKIAELSGLSVGDVMGVILASYLLKLGLEKVEI